VELDQENGADVSGHNVKELAMVKIEPANLSIMVLLCILNIAIGLFLLLKPSLTIELQRRFYEKINWRMEPISMEKEIRNTGIMGASLIVLTAAAIIYFLTSNM
jgi:hypothetical protein